MNIQIIFKDGKVLETYVVPNIGTTYSKKDHNNLNKWVSKFYNEDDVHSCKLL